jgi:hypothetical protein
MQHSSIVRDANKLLLNQFGLTNHRLQIIYVSRRTVYISPEGKAREEVNQQTRPPTNRKEKYLYTSTDRQREMSVTLDIRKDKLIKVEIEASPRTLAAGKAWAQKIRADIPDVKIAINGQKN